MPTTTAPAPRGYAAQSQDWRLLARKDRAWLGVFHAKEYGAVGDDAADDTTAIKDAITAADGGTLYLERDKVYRVKAKLQLNALITNGIRIIGNNATIKAAATFTGNVLFTATNLDTDTGFENVEIEHLVLDANGVVSRTLFGHWLRCRFSDVTIRGGTQYQANAVFTYCVLSGIRVIGNATQGNNGFDCTCTDTVISEMDVDMGGNVLQSAFWQNSSQRTTIINLRTIDGLTGIGYESCDGLTFIDPVCGYSGAAPGANSSIDGFPGSAGSKNITIINPMVDRVNGTGYSLTFGNVGLPHSDITIIGGHSQNDAVCIRLNNQPTRVRVLGFDFHYQTDPTKRIVLTGSSTKWDSENKVVGCTGVADSSGTATITTGSTPDVTGNEYVEMNYAAAENVTNFIDARASGSSSPYVARRVGFLFDNSNVTLKQGTTLQLQDGIDYTPAVGETIQFMLVGTVWYETARRRGNIASALTTDSSDTDATSYVTASVSPRANKLEFLTVENAKGAGPSIPTVTGCGLTWVQVATVTFFSIAGPLRRLTLFRAMGATPTAGALTIDFTGNTQTGCAWSVIEVITTDTSGTNGSGAIVQSVTANADTVSSISPALAAFGAATNYTFLFVGLGADNDIGSSLTAISAISGTFPPQRMESFFQGSANTAPDSSWTGATGAGAIGVEVKRVL